MPEISKVRTPIRLLAMPSRTFFFGSLFAAKNAFNASERESGSRSSPATTMPGARSARTTWVSSATPLFEMRAAASWEPPLFGEGGAAGGGPPALEPGEPLHLMVAALAAGAGERRERREREPRQGE